MNVSSWAKSIKTNSFFMIPIFSFILGVFIAQLTHIESSGQFMLISFVVLMLLFTSIACRMRCDHKIKHDQHLITTFNQVKEELQAAECSNFAKSAFIAKLGHEIKTPLAHIAEISSALRLAISNEEQRALIKTLNESSQQLINLLNNLLDFSEIESGELKLENIPFNLKDTISNSITDFQYQANLRGLKTLLEYDDTLSKRYKGDPEKLSLVIEKIFLIALKSTYTGSIKTIVSNITNANLPPHSFLKQKIEIQIIDTGIGIDRQEMNSLYDFAIQKENNTSSRFRGNELELSISKGIINAMGGNISVCSNKNGGTSFSIAIELEQSS